MTMSRFACLLIYVILHNFNQEILANEYIHCAYFSGPALSHSPKQQADYLQTHGDLYKSNKTSKDQDIVNGTIRCQKESNYCFTLWNVDVDDQNKTVITKSRQGCWLASNSDAEKDQCDSTLCVSDSPGWHYPNEFSQVKFCCCSGDMCNINFTDIYDPSKHQSTQSSADAVYIRDYADPGYKQRAIIIALVPVISVAILAVIIFFVYRKCTTPRRREPQLLCSVESPPPPPAYDIEDLKFITLINKGRYSEVWQGTVHAEDIAIKIYKPPHKQFFLNEKYVFSLPFIEHENLLKFYGSDERVQPDGSKFLLIFKYIENGSLMSYLKNNIIDWTVMCKMFYSVCQGLAHLHTDCDKDGRFKPVVAHRDFNTRNILVKSDLSCVIGDFGFTLCAMGSKIIRNGVSENAEQSSLTDVGTLRYMAPELLDGAVNLRDCEASLKQIDIYALGLVLWEIASRCSDLYQGLPTPEYSLPFQEEAGLHPTFEEMQLLVSRNKTRPKFPDVWKSTNQAIKALKDTIEECWDADADARLTAYCVEARIVEVATLWCHDAKYKGTSSTFSPTQLLYEFSLSDKSQTMYGYYSDNLDSNDLSPVEVNDQTTALLINNCGTGTTDLHSTNCRRSWMQDRSVSNSTTVTMIPITPSDSDGPVKANNIVNAQNRKAFQPHQGRNPTAERNTHKSSDEELRIKGNKLIRNIDGQDSESSNGAPVQTNETTIESVNENIDSALVQNDVLSQHHRNPPIPYLQNCVQSNTLPSQPKIVNSVGNGAAVINITQNQQKSRSFLGRLIFGTFFNRKGGFKSPFSRSRDSSPQGLNKNTVNCDGSQRLLDNPIVKNSNLLSQQIMNSNISPINTEIRIENGSAITIPSNQTIPQSQSHSNLNTAQQLESRRQQDKRLAIAEVGIAKLEKVSNGHPFIMRVNGGQSKSLSDLKSKRSMSTVNSGSNLDLRDFKIRRPNSLSLKSHSKVEGSPNILVEATTNYKHYSDVNQENTKDKIQENTKDKIRRRVKTPLTISKGRFSLYDDRLMFQSTGEIGLNKKEVGITRSSISLHQFKGLDTLQLSHNSDDQKC